ncbi:hypothetical protein MACH26_28200 [Planctobacterium marinum]|uniref:PKD domain-containing protein n=2 Tax=Planctobacterium marinum TaxID=1631968 RepID=A0AA48HL91_9ALTE|nr:hypothetical protein MACH26_28200 [Planctobacterium marinum]
MLALSSGVYAGDKLDLSLNNTNMVPAVQNANGASKERVIVKFKRGKGNSAKAAAKAAGGELKVDLAKHDAFAIEVPSVALNGLRNNPNVEYIETDQVRKLLNTNLDLTEIEPWGISRVEADVVSDASAGNQTVCIIDSGYDITHSDLSNNLVSGTNDSGTGQWSTPGGSHGTHVAGTIAGMTNGSGVVGVAPNGNVNLHIIKVFNESGWGYSSSLIAAVDDCVAAGSNIVSMSLGGSGSSASESSAFENYYNQGVLSIAAAGNDGNTAHSYPASYDAVVSVAAVDSGNMHANFSQRTNQVELSGPGEAVLSSVAIGDGQLAQLSVDGVDYFANGVVPHLFYNSSLSFAASGNDGSVSGILGVCSTSGTSYSCGDMTGKICLVERAENQADNTTSTENNYPEYRAANACADANAAGIVIYSNAARPGLQAPFLVDFDAKIEGVPTASVDRATGLELATKAGLSASLSKAGNQDWDYYNGTSMATPHVSAVAALVWSYHPTCSAAEIRSALAAAAEDLDTAGRDNKTGYGLVKTQATIDYLTTNGCTGGGPAPSEPTELTNGVTESGLSGAASDELEYLINVPSGASDLVFNMSGGTGDADLYVRFGAQPTTTTYDCRPYASGNTEECSFAAPQTGTYYATVIGYSSFSGVDLVAGYNTGAPNEAPLASFTYACTDLGCNFDASGSSDTDGSVVSYSWSFGDGSNGSGQNTSNNYSAAGSYTVTLTVTDDDGATDSTSQTVTVTEPVSSAINLSLSTSKSKGTKYVDLSWSGANGSNVDVYRTRRGTTSMVTTANDGAFTDSFGGGGGATYKVCEEGTNNCSDEATAVF